VLAASFHYFLEEKSMKTGEISTHTHLLHAAAAIVFEEASYVLYSTR
jgi:hypothetical protein